MIYMGKDRVKHAIQDSIQRKVDRVWKLILNQHNYFTAIRPNVRYCQHGRAVCLCHAEVKT